MRATQGLAPSAHKVDGIGWHPAAAAGMIGACGVCVSSLPRVSGLARTGRRLAASLKAGSRRRVSPAGRDCDVRSPHVYQVGANTRHFPSAPRRFERPHRSCARPCNGHRLHKRCHHLPPLGRLAGPLHPSFISYAAPSAIPRGNAGMSSRVPAAIVRPLVVLPSPRGVRYSRPGPGLANGETSAWFP